MTNTMTTRDFLNLVINANLSDEATAKAKAMLESLDKRNKARAEKPTKAQVENAPLIEALVALLSDTDEPLLSTAIATALGVSTSKATGLLGNLFKEGKVEKLDIKVKGKGTQKGWVFVK